MVLMMLGIILIAFGAIFVFATAAENNKGAEKGRLIIALIALIAVIAGTNILTKLTMVG